MPNYQYCDFMYVSVLKRTFLVLIHVYFSLAFCYFAVEMKPTSLVISGVILEHIENRIEMFFKSCVTDEYLETMICAIIT